MGKVFNRCIPSHRNFIKSACANSIGTTFVLLDLLENHTNFVPQNRLTEAKFTPMRLKTLTNVKINGIWFPRYVARNILNPS